VCIEAFVLESVLGFPWVCVPGPRSGFGGGNDGSSGGIMPAGEQQVKKFNVLPLLWQRFRHSCRQFSLLTAGVY
jgi:hypothetical protein